MSKSFLISVIAIIFCTNDYFAQNAYTSNQYGYRKDSNIVYGTATGFDGITDTLVLDIYKPLLDNNCRRPVLVLVHGGAWLTGSKDEGYIPSIAQKFVKSGWVVAAINYRLGMHKASFHTQYALCEAEPCSYFADSSEIFRATFRAQQDVKGAIRFMKNRNVADSTDIGNFYLAGESAGGFNVLTAAFMDLPTEKFSQAFTIADAPNPDSDLVGCLETGYSLSRPDLGDIHGDLHLGTNDASVQGVGSIYGALFNTDILVNTSSWPALYFFHQGSDVIVNYNYGKVLGRMDWECFAAVNLCQGYNYGPRAYGGKGLKNYLNGLGTPPSFTADIIENYTYGTPSPNCTAGGHALDNESQRMQNMMETFAERINTNGNLGPNCNLAITESTLKTVSFFPNPASNKLTIRNIDPNTSVRIIDLNGSIVFETSSTSNQVTVNTSTLENGVYFVCTTSQIEVGMGRVIISH